MWKIDRLTEEQLEDYLLRLNDEPVSAVYDDIDALELDGLASGSCSVTKAGEGKLWWPSKFQPQIKFFEPQLGYLLSHDLRPDRVDAPSDIECDTTVHVFFSGNELKWAKFFNDPRTVDGGWGGDDEFIANYSPVGHFERYYRRGPTSVNAQFYTNDVDVREEQPESEDRYTYDGQDRGYSQYIFEIDHYAVPPANHGAGDLLWSRRKLFFKSGTDRFEKVRLTGCAVVVPAWFRESMLIAGSLFEHLRDGVDRWHWQVVTDPNYGLEYAGDGDNKVDENSYSNLDSVSELYALTKPFADEGIWCNPGDEVAFSGALPPTNQGASTFIPGYTFRTLTITMVCPSDHSPRVVKVETRTGSDASLWEPKWFVPSPHPDFGDTQYHHATMNAYGDSDALIYLEDIDGSRNVIVGTPEDAAFESRLPIFIGVV